LICPVSICLFYRACHYRHKAINAASRFPHYFLAERVAVLVVAVDVPVEQNVLVVVQAVVAVQRNVWVADAPVVDSQAAHWAGVAVGIPSWVAV